MPKSSKMKNMEKAIIVALFALGAFFSYKSHEYYVVAKEAKKYDFIDRNTLSSRVAIDMSKHIKKYNMTAKDKKPEIVTQ